MSPYSDGADPVNCYAVVSYLAGPLAAFVDAFRREVDPTSELRAHVTILPPRPLNGGPASVPERLRAQAGRVSPFVIEATEVRVFEQTQVIYLEVGAGVVELSQLNRALNDGPLGSTELFPYHPHITLAQELDDGSFSKVLDLARKRWDKYRESRRLAIDRLTLVQYSVRSGWLDLAEFRLGSAK